MSQAQTKSENDWQFPAPVLDLRTDGWDRFLAALKSFLVHAIWIWIATSLVAQLALPKQFRWRKHRPIAVVVALPMAALLATRRFVWQYHRLTADDDSIVLKNLLGQVRLAPDEVQGIVGTGGANLQTSETDVWKEIVLLTRGRRYRISFDKHSNELCYEQLRELCPHAWGIPYRGRLETPIAGPELDPDDYVESLKTLRSFYLLYTQKTLFNGLLLVVGSLIAGAVLAQSMPLNGRGVVRLYVWLLIVAFVGLIMAIRALKQIPVLLKVRYTEQRLREAL